MLFYQLKFLIPYLLFLIPYRLVGIRWQNAIIVSSSYFFYGMWDWRFLFPLIFQTISDYIIANMLHRYDNSQQSRRLLVTVSIVTNLCMLGYFKYFNFFIDSFAALFPSMSPAGHTFLTLALPPAMSFYTFESMSYVIDVYRRKIKPEKNFVDFAAFIAFFPKLVAGPIERAHTLLAQITSERVLTIDKTISGVRLFIWGVFKKVVIADNLGVLADPVFANPGQYDPITLLIAAYCFTFQIYCDFSGYTDMARGVSRIMGIELSINFNLPYFATSMRDFWHRWHITLSTWFRDYVYISLGGNRSGLKRMLFNLMVVFLLSGLWHGAAWTFVFWGAVHGLLVCLEAAIERTKYAYFFERLPTTLKQFFTFHAVVLLWILFRSEDFAHFSQFIGAMTHLSLPDTGQLVRAETWLDVAKHLLATVSPQSLGYTAIFSLFALPLLTIQYFQYRKQRLDFDIEIAFHYQVILYSLILFSIIALGAPSGKQFIYFQF